MANPDLWSGKNVFIIATMGLFSGDGAGVPAHLLHEYGAIAGAWYKQLRCWEKG